MMSRHPKEEAGPSSQKAPKVERRVPNFRNGGGKLCCLQVTHLWSFFYSIKQMKTGGWGVGGLPSKKDGSPKPFHSRDSNGDRGQLHCWEWAGLHS